MDSDKPKPDLAKAVEDTIETLLHRASEGHITGEDALAFAQAAAALLSTPLGEVVTSMIVDRLASDR